MDTTTERFDAMNGWDHLTSDECRALRDAREASAAAERALEEASRNGDPRHKYLAREADDLVWEVDRLERLGIQRAPRERTKFPAPSLDLSDPWAGFQLL